MVALDAAVGGGCSENPHAQSVCTCCPGLLSPGRIKFRGIGGAVRRTGAEVVPVPPPNPAHDCETQMSRWRMTSDWEGTAAVRKAVVLRRRDISGMLHMRERVANLPQSFQFQESRAPSRFRASGAAETKRGWDTDTIRLLRPVGQQNIPVS